MFKQLAAWRDAGQPPLAAAAEGLKPGGGIRGDA
jgi:hypothetical protein